MTRQSVAEWLAVIVKVLFVAAVLVIGFRYETVLQDSRDLVAANHKLIHANNVLLKHNNELLIRNNALIQKLNERVP